MEFKDASPEISAVAQHYSGHKLPPIVLRLQDLLLQFLQWVQEWLNKIFRHHTAGPSDNKSMSILLQYAVYFLGAIALLAICYLLWKRVSSSREEQAATKRGAVSVDKILDSQGYRQEAGRLASARDYKGACRALYLCFLQNMHEKTVAVFAPAKTNFEYRYLLAAYPPLQSGFTQLIEIVENVWFGNKNAEEDDYTRCLQILAETEPEVERIGAANAAKRKLETEQ